MEVEKRKTFFLLIASVIFLIGCIYVWNQESKLWEKVKRPNIIVIMADDLVR